MAPATSLGGASPISSPGNDADTEPAPMVLNGNGDGSPDSSGGAEERG